MRKQPLVYSWISFVALGCTDLVHVGRVCLADACTETPSDGGMSYFDAGRAGGAGTDGTGLGGSAGGVGNTGGSGAGAVDTDADTSDASGQSDEDDSGAGVSASCDSGTGCVACTHDEDCVVSLGSPYCDPVSSRCASCPTQEQQSALLLRIVVCFSTIQELNCIALLPDKACFVEICGNYCEQK